MNLHNQFHSGHPQSVGWVKHLSRQYCLLDWQPPGSTARSIPKSHNTSSISTDYTVSIAGQCLWLVPLNPSSTPTLMGWYDNLPVWVQPSRSNSGSLPMWASFNQTTGTVSLTTCCRWRKSIQSLAPGLDQKNNSRFGLVRQLCLIQAVSHSAIGHSSSHIPNHLTQIRGIDVLPNLSHLASKSL